jgi:hypothetical protein
MMKRIFAAALVFAAVCFSACGNRNEPEATPTPTPDPLAALRDEIGTIADAEVAEEEGTLSINILVDETDAEAACAQFFDEAGQIYTNCLSGTEYTGICFSLLTNGIIAGGLYVLPDEGGMKVMEPVSLSEEYDDALLSAFYDSAFARSFQG